MGTVMVCAVNDKSGEIRQYRVCGRFYEVQYAWFTQDGIKTETTRSGFSLSVEAMEQMTADTERLARKSFWSIITPASLLAEAR